MSLLQSVGIVRVQYIAAAAVLCIIHLFPVIIGFEFRISIFKSNQIEFYLSKFEFESNRIWFKFGQYSRFEYSNSKLRLVLPIVMLRCSRACSCSDMLANYRFARMCSLLGCARAREHARIRQILASEHEHARTSSSMLVPSSYWVTRSI